MSVAIFLKVMLWSFKKEAMDVKYGFFIYLSLIAIFSGSVGKDVPAKIARYINVQTGYNLRSEDAITRYILQRLNQLSTYIKSADLASTIKFIIDDPDFDSYLFIFESENPNRLLAYSRQPEWCNKTPQELQRDLEPDCTTKCFTEKSVKQIISITREISTYTGYQWKMSKNDPIQYFIAYTQLVTIDEKKYVIGATIQSSNANVQIILPHRIDQVLKRIKQEGLEHVATTINKSLDYGYFFIIDRKYPYRFITHREPWAGLTPREATIKRNPGCKSVECDAEAVVQGFMRSLKPGGAFSVYPWINRVGEEPILKITYIKPFEYQKKKYFIGTGLPADIPIKKTQDLQKFVHNAIRFIDEVGLENAISAAKKANKPDRYVFIMEAEYPYRFILHMDSNYNQRTALEIQSYIDSRGKSSMNILDLTKNLAEHSKKGGGFAGFKFLVDMQNPQKGITLKVYYTQLIKNKGKEYVVGTGIPVEHAYSELVTDEIKKER